MTKAVFVIRTISNVMLILLMLTFAAGFGYIATHSPNHHGNGFSAVIISAFILLVCVLGVYLVVTDIVEDIKRVRS